MAVNPLVRFPLEGGGYVELRPSEVESVHETPRGAVTIRICSGKQWELSRTETIRHVRGRLWG